MLKLATLRRAMVRSARTRADASERLARVEVTPARVRAACRRLRAVMAVAAFTLLASYSSGL